METLGSFLAGRWQTGADPASKLYDPTRGEAIAETSTRGLDFGEALRHARFVGGPTLRAMTFAQRGELLGAIASALHEHRDELLSLSTVSGGNTRGDAKFDVDGCTGTIAYYAKLGRELGDGRFLGDGDLIPLSRNPRFIGAHLKVPRLGVAIHINAFNFPGWGFGEKAACALLAGMPVVTKPATSTSVLTHRMFRILTEAGVLPDGVLSLVCGSAGDLLDHVECQDVLAFTGSADTGMFIRGLERVRRMGVRVNIEADSLNAAILGPDLDSDSEGYQLFLREVLKDLTQKAGQKCTAIRRIFVPWSSLELVREDLREGYAAVRVGNPAVRGVQMGPVATASQLTDVREGVSRLAAHGRFVFGDGGPGELVDATDEGYFVGPTLIEVAGIDEGGPVHDLEVFGPVQTIIPYDGSVDEAVRGVIKAQGGLVASVYTDDKRFAWDVVLGLAPYHGRLHIGSSKIAAHSTGPGTVLPQLVHGGPGRAGGGEELGGLRGLDFYLQRTAIQGLKPLVQRIVTP
jgi:oxepin-CoA hydrolase/3-oxo-5,6-dehydrosuberyl-CoA semialdehyde dehydrogenase